MELVTNEDMARDVPDSDDTVRVDPVKEVKYPVVVERVGTLIDDRTVKEEVT